MNARRGAAIDDCTIRIHDAAILVGALVHDFFRDGKRARGCPEPASPRSYIAPSDVLIVAKDVGFLLAEINFHSHRPWLTRAVPDIQRRG